MKYMQDRSNNLLMNAINTALHSLRQWTDPAYEGSPFDADVDYATPVSKIKPVFLRKKALIRM